jgi:hypothetical protein
VQPGTCILLEDPFGKARREITNLIDHVLYLDVPQDICVIRLVCRSMGLGPDVGLESLFSENRENLLERIHAAHAALANYLFLRPGFEITSRIKRSADCVLDGTQPLEAVAQAALAYIQELLPGSPHDTAPSARD